MKRFLLLSIFLIVAACDSKKDEPQKTDIDKDEPAMPAQTTREPAKPAAPPAAQGMSDAEIATIASTAHTVEMQAAELVAKKTKNKDVQEFAQMMITDHGAAKAKGEKILAEAGMTPMESDMSKQLMAKGEETKKKLEGLDGAELDRAYVDDQVMAHQEVLDAIDSKLLPGASHMALKALLTEARPMVAGHLEHAKALAEKLKTAK
jgi:putative membrane protein